MEDLIQNAHNLFDEGPSQTPPIPSANVPESMSTYTYGSLFLSPELPRPTNQRHPGLVDGIPTSTQSSFSSLPEDPTTDSHRTPSPPGLLGPLLGLPSSKTLTGVEASTQEQVMPEVSGPKTVEKLANSNPAEAVSNPLSSVTEWQLHQSRLSPHSAALTIPQSLRESVPSNMSEYPISSATSLQTGMGGFSS